ncbi:MAG: hypothetical protein JW990_06050, partial [Thermoleophilia bacterium]|nr:hypothetical protein [Thermoleophilia bacterium]
GRLGAPAAATIACALAAAAIVIPLSLGAVSLGESPDATADVPPAAPRVSTTTATSPATTTTVPVEDEQYAWYSDDRYGFAMKYPASWRNTDPSEVGERLYRRVIESYSETFVPVAFADWSSPTFNGCYLDYVWVEVYDEAFMEVPTLPELRDYAHAKLDHLRTRYEGVESLQPPQDVVVGGLSGFEHVWSIPYGGRVLMLRECVLVDEGRAYFMQFAAVEEDWEECRPVFEDMLRDFTVRGPHPLS